jgi:hypothetical protein
MLIDDRGLDQMPLRDGLEKEANQIAQRQTWIEFRMDVWSMRSTNSRFFKSAAVILSSEYFTIGLGHGDAVQLSKSIVCDPYFT